ncbi:hypothetical protein KEM56_004182 [Ascosphaera pollenicola]|nr:hypothetical protein KEM56_004182 [Ascosphaera pollenicola]
MATATVSTPLKSHHGLFSSKTAGGRMPLTPSPHTAKAANMNTKKSPSKESPFTPPKQVVEEKSSSRAASSVYSNGNLSSRFHAASRVSARPLKDSPKSNIAVAKAKAKDSPRGLEMGVSEFTLSGTGPGCSVSPTKPIAKKDTNAKSKPAKSSSKLSRQKPDRFIPDRMTSEGLATAGAAKPDETTKITEGSTVLANAASAYDIGGGRASDDDLTTALEGLGLEDDDTASTSSSSRPAPEAVAYESTLANACEIGLNTRILSFKPPAPESSKPIDLRAQYNRPLKSKASSAQFRRRIQTAPERVLDAPGLVDDYYLNLLDWSSGNQVAIGLERSVYVWSADSGSVDCLFETTPDTYISSVKWSGDGAYVSVGLGTGEIQIWDVEEGTKLRSMFGHDSRVGVMSWSKHTLSTGARDGLIFNHDVRVAKHKTAELSCHTSEVCGLEWRADGAQLASGGNDNLVAIWDARSLSAPKFTKTNHRAAVKALSWCPWQNNLLATGGGSYDRHIHFWNTTTGARVNSIDTGSQVTSLRWSNHYKELVSSSGFPDNSLSIWSHPSLVRNIEIPAHETRVLHSSLSPDGQMLATAAADESLKFWKVFERKPGTAAASSRDGSATGKGKAQTKSMTIR